MAFANNPKLVNTGAGFCEQLSHTHVGGTGSAFTKGELVFLNAGVVTVCASNATLFFGQALVDDGATATEVQCIRILPEQVWKIKLWDASDAAVKAASNFTVGKAYGLVLVSNIWYADYDDSADAIVYQGPALAAGETTANCYWGLFKFITTACQSQTGN